LTVSVVSWSFPPFRPHPLLANGHAQTLAGAYLPGRSYCYRARRHCIELDDGDALILHDDCPAGWRNGDRVALLIHGLGGCHASGYMQRIAHKLSARGVRAFRMDLRGCGAGVAVARLPYHSGRSEDAAAAIRAIELVAPASPVALIGFSLGGNITLKLAGELGGRTCGNLERTMAVCPPVDLSACSRHISQRRNRLYDRYFVGLLLGQLKQRHRQARQAPAGRFAGPPRTLWEFDNGYTAVVCGFGTADNYYAEASSLTRLAEIRLPTLILSARDDPLIPPDALEGARLPGSVKLCMSEQGGHLGFVGRGRVDADRRWMDWRVVEWVLAADRTAPAVSRSASRDAASAGAR
jgi:predicted alpha/beta-fold hydrolase